MWHIVHDILSEEVHRRITISSQLFSLRKFPSHAFFKKNKKLTVHA